ncbi:MAG: hypothetical protein POH28_03390 [Acidocella sp.]|nr:hypothetical protein [Acidocella sp.]
MLSSSFDIETVLDGIFQHADPLQPAKRRMIEDRIELGEAVATLLTIDALGLPNLELPNGWRMAMSFPSPKRRIVLPISPGTPSNAEKILCDLKEMGESASCELAIEATIIPYGWIRIVEKMLKDIVDKSEVGERVSIQLKRRRVSLNASIWAFTARPQYRDRTKILSNWLASATFCHCEICGKELTTDEILNLRARSGGSRLCEEHQRLSLLEVKRMAAVLSM